MKIEKNVIGMWAALKGLMMLLVVLIHTIYDSEIICGQQVYPIPFRALCKGGAVILFTFFMINGYLFKEKKKKGKIWSRYFSYLKIYVVSLTAMTMATMVHNLYLSESVLKGAASVAIGGIYGAGRNTYLFGYKLSPPLAMWFILVLMNANLILDLAMKMKGERKIRLLLFGVPFFYFLQDMLVGSETEAFFLNMPFYPAQSFLAAALLYIGHQMKKKSLLFSPVRGYWKAVVAAVALFGFFFGQIDMQMNQYRLGILDYIGAVCGAIAVIYVYIHAANPEWKITEWLMWVGRRSLWIIPIHCVEGILFEWENAAMLSRLGMYGSTAVIFVLRCIIILMGCEAMERLQENWRRRKVEMAERH